MLRCVPQFHDSYLVNHVFYILCDKRVVLFVQKLVKPLKVNSIVIVIRLDNYRLQILLLVLAFVLLFIYVVFLPCRVMQLLFLRVCLSYDYSIGYQLLKVIIRDTALFDNSLNYWARYVLTNFVRLASQLVQASLYENSPWGSNTSDLKERFRNCVHGFKSEPLVLS